VSEILLPSDNDHSFICVLSSLNLAKYDEWKDTDTIFNATVFLDCVVSEFIDKAKHTPGLENAVRFAQKSRAIGLGVCGWHTFLQQRMIAFESLEAHMWNSLIFKEIHDKSLQASKWMGREWGCPEWGNGEVRNCSRIAVAPTKSTALIMGGVSEGINPDPAMVFTQATAGGEVSRVNPVLLDLMKKKGVYNKKNVQEVNEAFGSVQDVDWLTDDEKKVFRTAFEIDQSVVIRQAASRGKYIDQWQSLNLFFGGTEDPAYVSKVHQKAFLDEGIVGLYYVYSRSEAKGSIDRGECLACQ
jgi:ribonucleoside-diphosphate reductase alpha chain